MFRKKVDLTIFNIRRRTWRFSKGCKTASFQQSARCTVVKQPDPAAFPPKSGRIVKDLKIYELNK